MTHRILILGGTTEARQLAGRLAHKGGLAVMLSLAGRTAAPMAQPVPTRVGGFGGAAGLAHHLCREEIDLLVDATHPFAVRISANAIAAAENAGVPLVVLRRPPWRRRDGDRWTAVADVDGAVAALGASPRRVLFDIILPLSTPGLIAGAAISFVSSVGNFGIPAILGIPASIFTLPTLIYSRFASFGTSTFGDIAILSTMIAIISVAGLALQERAMKGRDYRIIGLSGKAATFRLGLWRLPAELALWLVLFFMLVAPLTALVASSLAPAYGVPLSLKTATLHAYEELLYRQSVTRTAFRNSLFLATATSLCLLAVTVLTA